MTVLRVPTHKTMEGEGPHEGSGEAASLGTGTVLGLGLGGQRDPRFSTSPRWSGHGSRGDVVPAPRPRAVSRQRGHSNWAKWSTGSEVARSCMQVKTAQDRTQKERPHSKDSVASASTRELDSIDLRPLGRTCGGGTRRPLTPGSGRCQRTQIRETGSPEVRSCASD